MPNLCMNPAVRYTTNASTYDRLHISGMLTDAAIARYIREGRYGKIAQETALRTWQRAKRKTISEQLLTYK